MSYALSAFLLGLFSFIPFMFIGEFFSYHFGEKVALAAVFILLTVYFFVCQFFLSRGNPKAFPKDWPIMLALAVGPLFYLIPAALLEKRDEVIAEGRVILLSCLGGTLIGAFAASWEARRKARRQ